MSNDFRDFRPFCRLRELPVVTSVRCLIVRTGALGDVLMLLPLVQRLHEQNGWQVQLVTQSSQTGLLSRFHGVAGAISADAAELWRLYSGDPKACRLPSCDRVLAFLKDPDGALEAGLRAATGAEVSVFSPFPEARSQRHVSEYYLGCVVSETEGPIRWPRFNPASADLAGMASWRHTAAQDRPLWAVHPGSGSPSKNWPAERFGEVAARLAARGRRLVLLLGPAERDHRDFWIRIFSHVQPALACDWTLERIGALLTGCEGYLGNDSGITHLAAALGVNTVAVYGPTTQPERWGPRGDRIHMLKAGSGAWPTEDAVSRAVEAASPDRPADPI